MLGILIGLQIERWFLSSNAKDIGVVYLMFALFSGLVGTAYSVLIRLELEALLGLSLWMVNSALIFIEVFLYHNLLFIVHIIEYIYVLIVGVLDYVLSIPSLESDLHYYWLLLTNLLKQDFLATMIHKRKLSSINKTESEANTSTPLDMNNNTYDNKDDDLNEKNEIPSEDENSTNKYNAAHNNEEDKNLNETRVDEDTPDLIWENGDESYDPMPHIEELNNNDQTIDPSLENMKFESDDDFNDKVDVVETENEKVISTYNISREEFESGYDTNNGSDNRVIGFFTHFLNTVHKKGVFLYIDLIQGVITHYKEHEGSGLHHECNKFISDIIQDISQYDVVKKLKEEKKEIIIYAQSGNLNKELIPQCEALNFNLVTYSMHNNCPKPIKSFKVLYKMKSSLKTSITKSVETTNDLLISTNWYASHFIDKLPLMMISKTKSHLSIKKSFSTFAPINHKFAINTTLNQKRSFSSTTVCLKLEWGKIPVANILIGDNVKNIVNALKEKTKSELENAKMMIQLRMKNKKGLIRSLSVLDTIGKDDFSIFEKALRNRVGYLKERYDKDEISEVFFHYAYVNKDYTTKVDSPVYNISPKDKDWGSKILDSLPNNLDYTSWGSVSMLNDSYIEIIIENDKIKFNVEVIKDKIKNINILKISARLIGGQFLVGRVEDRIISNSHFVRHHKDVIYEIKDGEIINKKRIENCNYISPLKNPKKSPQFKIMTLDIETKEVEYSDLEGKLHKYLEPICICLRVKDKSYTFAIWDYANVDEMIKEFLNTILRKEHDDYKIYAHNLSGFDIIFLLKHLQNSDVKTSLSAIIRDEKIISLTQHFNQVKKRDESAKEEWKNSVTYLDSLNILPSSLKKLSDIFSKKSENLSKSLFPLKIVNDINIDFDYEGDVPSIDYFYDITESEYIEYKEKFKDKKWSLKKELIKYCEQDVISLQNIMISFLNSYYDKYKIDVMRYPTITSLAFANFRTNYLKKSKIPILKGDIYNFIKQAYFGGYCDVINPRGLNVYSYDVNSLYPYVMWKYPMPTGKVTYVEGENLELKNLFGFVECEVNAPTHLKCPTLPIRLRDKGVTIYPVGNFSGYYFTEILKKLEKYGYKFKVKRGYTFEQKVIFKDFVNDMYAIKSSVASDNPLYLISKLNMNSLYGRFGMSPYLPDTEFIPSEDIIKFQTDDDIIIKDFKDFGEMTLLTYYNKSEENFSNISIAISAAISAYSLMEMSDVIMKESNNLICVDTDGIKTLSPIGKDYVDSKKLGKFKEEDFFVKFATIAPKLYGGITKKGKSIVKAKGLKTRESINVYSLLYLLDFPDRKIERYQDKWYKKITEATIVIDVLQRFEISPTDNKREWIYDSLGRIINSRPFLINKNEIIEWENKAIIYYLPLREYSLLTYYTYYLITSPPFIEMGPGLPKVFYMPPPLPSVIYL